MNPGDILKNIGENKDLNSLRDGGVHPTPGSAKWTSNLKKSGNHFH